MLLLFTGEVIDITEAKHIFITGPSLVHRARQVQCGLRDLVIAKINAAPGIKSVSSDDTDINGVNRSVRYLYYFDPVLGAPAKYPVIAVAT